MDLWSTLLGFLQSALTSKTGMVLAAVVLSALVWVLEKVPAVKTELDSNPWLKKVGMLFLAVAPAVAMVLSNGASWQESLTTALLTFLGALGVHSMLPVAKE